MESLLEFRDSLLDYLKKQKELEEHDLEIHKALTDDEKVEAGLLIKNAEVLSIDKSILSLQTFEDNSKLRIGDKVGIRSNNKKYFGCIVDLGLSSISIESHIPTTVGSLLDIEILEYVLLDNIINLLEGFEEGKPGASYLRQLAKIEPVKPSGIGKIDSNLAFIPENFNIRQKEVIADVFQKPSIYCIQGPPGTGKTAVLSCIADNFASQGKEVLVIANTHQAVNNALNKIKSSNPRLNVVKIGASLRTEGLNDSIIIAETYNQYLKLRKDKSIKKNQIGADIVGMTFQAAVVNVGLRNSGFAPNIALIDEAGQMPMTYAALLGTFGCGSFIFIGDDLQMPPIFHEGLASHLYSKSIFTFLRSVSDNIHKSLNVTYRMNSQICNVINKAFYIPNGIPLMSADFASERHLSLNHNASPTPLMSRIFEQKDSLFVIDPTQFQQYTNINQTIGPFQEQNAIEADFAYQLASYATGNGLKTEDIAVITPFRKQVKLIQQTFASKSTDMPPIINTVECLQGQDVELIIISFTTSDTNYADKIKQFLFNKNRLNVMISRAKTKVLFLASKILQEELFKIIDKNECLIINND